jgi:Raf kinase inhibitor-like YbhB/YbcL family protein
MPLTATATTLTVTCSAFRQGEPIPRHYTGDGMDVSPPLTWTEPPPGTKSFALICDDPDAPRGTWVHWVLYDLPPTCRRLPEAVPADPDLDDGSHQGTTDFGYVGYGGPAPPRGNAHRYFFKLYALDTELGLSSGAKKADVVAAMEGHVLAEGQVMGTYQR